LSTGTPKGLPDVVLLPGLGATGYLVPWARHASSWTRVSVLDLPGWRGGRARSCNPTLVDVARTTARWLETTGRDDVVLVGHSTGAQVALLATALAPGRVSGLALAGPTFDPAARSLPAAARRALATVRHESAGVAEVTVPSYVRSAGLPLLQFIRSALDDRPEDHVRAAETPVLVITGRQDPFCPVPWAEHLADLAGTVPHVVDGGHTAQYHDPGTADDLLHRAVRVWSR
jgi:pimeloyl-ACP methyl ester carboxylesterase